MLAATFKTLKRKKSKLYYIDQFLNEESRSLQQQVQFAEFTLVMFCISHNLPFLLMDFLPALLVECCPDSQIAKLVKCARTKSCQVAKILGNKSLEKIIVELKERKFSLIVDETTDISSRKALVLVVRYIDTLTCSARDRFMGLLEVIKTDANFFVLYSKNNK